LTAYWLQKLTAGEKLNVIVQRYEETVVNTALSTVIFVSTVPLNVAGSAVVLTVVPDTPVQLRETSKTGG